jgi:hypothetical protein
MRETAFLTLGLAVAAVGIVAAQTPEPQYGDSATFVPDGYYIPATDVVARGDTVVHFEVRTVEYYYDGSLHYDRPRLLRPRASVVIAHGEGGRTRHECRVGLLNRDQLSLSCVTPVGQVTLEAAYADKRGRYSNIIDYELGPRVVARGQLLIEPPAHPPQSTFVNLIYSAGH